jgi:hypothetical protein
MYNTAARDHRAGESAVLVSTLAAADAQATLDIYDEHFPNPQAKRRCFELMVLLDRKVTECRSKKENEERKRAMDEAKNRRKR